MEKRRYPIGIQTFSEIIEGGYVYFDKTALVHSLAHNGKVYFLSRPRRFGKSLLLSTLESYFKGQRKLFRGLAIDSLETQWEKYPVLRLSFGGQDYTNSSTLPLVLESFVASAEKVYGSESHEATIGDRFAGVIRRAHQQTGKRVVVLIDEYDKPLLDVMATTYTAAVDGNRISLEEYNRNILRGFYSVFKEADPDLRFVLLAGITKFSQISVFSGFNQPADISMSPTYDAICGITEEELNEQLSGQIEEMANIYRVTVDEMKRMLRQQYDGYHFSRRMTDIYNPFSILCAFNDMFLDDYWFKTGSPSYLLRLLAESRENINELVGKYYGTEDFIDYKADAERPLPMIYQSGYLTIKDFKPHTRAYLLDFPNDEVRQGLISALASGYFKASDTPKGWVTKVVDAFESGNLALLESLFTTFLSSIPYSVRSKKNESEKEKHFQYTFYLILRMISGYTVFAEKEQSEGRVDCIVETKNNVYIFEFKRDGSAETALNQICSKGYSREYAADPRTLHLVGVNFSSKTGTVDGWISKTANPA